MAKGSFTGGTYEQRPAAEGKKLGKHGSSKVSTASVYGGEDARPRVGDNKPGATRPKSAGEVKGTKGFKPC